MVKTNAKILLNMRNNTSVKERATWCHQCHQFLCQFLLLFDLSSVPQLSNLYFWKTQLICHLVWGGGGTRLCSWLRHCATSRKVAGSIPDLWHWNFLLTYSFRPQYGSGVDSTANRNEHQKYFFGGKDGRCIGLPTSSPTCAECLDIWEHQLSGILRNCNRFVRR